MFITIVCTTNFHSALHAVTSLSRYMLTNGLSGMTRDLITSYSPDLITLCANWFWLLRYRNLGIGILLLLRAFPYNLLVSGFVCSFNSHIISLAETHALLFSSMLHLSLLRMWSMCALRMLILLHPKFLASVPQYPSCQCLLESVHSGLTLIVVVVVLATDLEVIDECCLRRQVP